MDSEKLVNLFWDRSPEAIAQTQQAYGELCAKLAGRLLRRAEDVEECVNDTYLALWNGIPPARPANFGAYVAKIVRNLAMKRLSYLRNWMPAFRDRGIPSRSWRGRNWKKQSPFSYGSRTRRVANFSCGGITSSIP